MTGELKKRSDAIDAVVVDAVEAVEQAAAPTEIGRAHV